MNHSVWRTAAALAGTIPVALASGIALTLVLPLPQEQRLLVGAYSVFPVWVGMCCLTFLTASARRAWLALGVALMFAVAVASAALALGRGVAAAEVRS